MNNEIKEILEGIEIVIIYGGTLEIDAKELKLLLDYITNLQERKITKEDVDKYFEENMMVSFDKFIENWEEQEEFTKYLQEELKDYKQISIEHYKRPYAKRYLNELKKEIPNLLYPDSEMIYKDYYELKSRNEKAIRTLETLKSSARWERHLYEVDYLLNILNGGDDSE